MAFDGEWQSVFDIENKMQVIIITLCLVGAVSFKYLRTFIYFFLLKVNFFLNLLLNRLKLDLENELKL